MRPKLLEIEGLQSFKSTQIVDFETLGETGLFGIFGPTGSGKSTILDAITFALYGKVKRAENGTQGIINSGCDTARVSFTFELFRDGRRRTYRAERTYRRKKNTANACEPKVTRLIEVTDSGEIPLCDKAMEMTNYVKSLLGLGSDDFTRAVVLPQNSFQEFLMLSSSERRGMLERIFYLEEYGKQLTDKLNRKISVLKSSLDVMTGELKGYTDASDEAVAEAEKAAEEALAERARVEKEIKKLEARFEEAKEVWSLTGELAEFERRMEELTACGSRTEQERVRLEKAKKADELRDLINKNRELNESLRQTKEQLSEVQDMLPKIEDALNDAKAKYESIKKEAAAEQPKLVSRRTRLVDALEIKAEIKSLSDRINELNADIAKLDGEIAEKTKEISENTEKYNLFNENMDRIMNEMERLKTDPEYRQQMQEGTKLESEAARLKENVRELEDKHSEMKRSAESIAQRLEEVRKELEEYRGKHEMLTAGKLRHEESKPADKNTVLEEMGQIHSIDGIVQVLILRKKELDGQKSKLEQQAASLAQLEKEAGESDEKMNKAVENYRMCRQEAEKAERELNRNIAVSLASGLREGEPCPVCGSEHHPAPACHMEGVDFEALKKSAEETRKKLNDAEAALKDAEREALVANERLETCRQQYEQATKEFEQKKGEYEEARKKLPEKLRALEPEQMRNEVENAKSECNEKLEAIEAWEQKLEEYEESIRELEDSMTERRLAENGILTEQKMNNEGLEQVGNELAEAVDAFNRAWAKYSAFLEQYQIEDVAAEMNRIAQNDRALQMLQKEMEKTGRESADIGGLLNKLEEELHRLHTERIRLEAEINGLKEQVRTREAKLKELAADTDLEEEIKRVDEALNGYSEREKTLSQELEELEKQFNEWHGRKSILENKLNIYTESLKKDEDRFIAALAEKGFGSAEEVESFILPKEEQQELKKSIDDYDRELINIQAQMDLLRKKLNGRSITEEEWAGIDKEYTEMAAYKQECISKSEVARDTLSRLKKKHEMWLELSRTHNEMCHKMGLFEQIQKILKGDPRKDNSFIDYIAEERLRYVAANASQTLGTITKHRFSLELDTQSGFIIRDQANGGAHRMVTSLSGGEIFLTSLSLALALSEQIQLKGQSPLEFFFLDEGFGTLDHDLLDVVIDSLERLSSRERVIGLISHVPELKNRIARQLIVEPPTIQGDGSRIRIVKA